MSERREKQVMEELRMMVPALKPLVDPETGEETARTVELWLPEKKIRAWNTRCALNPPAGTSHEACDV